MNRKLLGLVAVAAVLALVVGVAVGRNLISSEAAPPQKADVIRVKDAVSKTSIAYPATWKVLPPPEGDPQVVLSVKRDDSASLRVRATATEFPKVTPAGLPVVRKFTDDLIGADDRVKLLQPPNTVELGGLLGWRYRYTYGSAKDGGAHDHYFMFKDSLLIQIVFQAVPMQRLKDLTPVFERIAATFRGEDA